jgi:hypothetical protein
MTKAKQYDTVMLSEAIGVFQKGEKGAVVEVYTTLHEAYDIEIVTDEGKTKGLAEAVRPEQIEVVCVAPGALRFSAIRLEADGTSAAVFFSDGTQVIVKVQELYDLQRVRRDA